MTIPVESYGTPPRGDLSALQSLIDESRALRVDLAQRAAAQRRVVWAVLACVLVAVLMLGIQLTILVQNRQRSNESRALIRENGSTSAAIADCTREGGQCFERNNTRTGLLLVGLMRYQADVALCTRSTNTANELKRCTDQALASRLAAAPPRPTAAPTPDAELPAPGSPRTTPDSDSDVTPEPEPLPSATVEGESDD